MPETVHKCLIMKIGIVVLILAPDAVVSIEEFNYNHWLKAREIPNR